MSRKWIAVLAVAVTAAAGSALGSAYAGGRATHRSMGSLKGTTWAVVASDGTLVRHGKHVTGASKSTGGEYVVTFDKGVANCAYTATLGDPGVGGFPGGQIAVMGSTVDGRMQVATFDSNNSLTDHPFHLIVACG